MVLSSRYPYCMLNPPPIGGNEQILFLLWSNSLAKHALDL